MQGVINWKLYMEMEKSNFPKSWIDNDQSGLKWNLMMFVIWMVFFAGSVNCFM